MSKPSASQSRAPLKAAVCESDATPRTKLDFVNGITTTLLVNFGFRRNTAIPIGMAEYRLKSGRIPPKSEWLAAMMWLAELISHVTCNRFQSLNSVTYAKQDSTLAIFSLTLVLTQDYKQNVVFIIVK